MKLYNLVFVKSGKEEIIMRDDYSSCKKRQKQHKTSTRGVSNTSYRIEESEEKNKFNMKCKESHDNRYPKRIK